ncbi:unnamed protein product, partial [Amoebophrya sp. A25]
MVDRGDGVFLFAKAPKIVPASRHLQGAAQHAASPSTSTSPADDAEQKKEGAEEEEKEAHEFKERVNRMTP